MTRYLTKNKEAGFDNDRVHVWSRRRTKDESYDLAPIYEDMEWLARYVLARKIQPGNISHEESEDVVHSMMLTAFKYCGKYPYENELGGKDPAFAYFTVVMYRAGITHMKKYRARRHINNTMPEDYEPSAAEAEEPPMFIVEKIEQIHKLALKEWLFSQKQDTRLRKLLKETSLDGRVRPLSSTDAVNRYYQAIMMLTLDKDSFPEAAELEPEFKLLALLIGEKRAGQTQFLFDMLEGNAFYEEG